MRAAGRDRLVLALSAAGAGLDAWSYFGLGHVFVANMTGNTVLLGFSAASGDRAQVAGSALALLFYFVGVFLGALLARPIRREMASRKPEATKAAAWPARATSILALECVLVVGSAVVNLLLAPGEGSLVAHLLIAVVAFSVGLQSAAIQALKLPGIVTTYITGTWTTLAGGLAELVDGEKMGRDREVSERRLGLEAAVLGVYGSSALVSGLLFHFFGRAVLGCSSALLLVAVVGGALLGQRGASRQA